MSYMQLRRNVYSVVGYSLLCMSVKFRWFNVLNPFSLQPSDWFRIIVSRVLKAKSWLIGKDWCWEGLGAGGEGDDRGWDGWMASLTRWTWVWVNSGSWWGQGGLACCDSWGRRVGHDWATELNWTELNWTIIVEQSVFPFGSILLHIFWWSLGM